MRSREIVICGLNAVRSRFEKASETVKRLFFSRAIAPELGEICRWMAQERLVYRCVEPEELERISGSVHHGGVVVVVEAEEIRSPRLDEVRRWAQNRETILLLDRISNVHNLGAIIRTAAFFGVTRIIIPEHPLAAVPTEATYRVAEGGLEHVQVYCVDHLPGFIRAIQSNYFVVGAAARNGMPLADRIPNRPCAIVLGNEEQGLDRDVMEACTELITIPGSGQMESLNVSATAAILLWRFTTPPNFPQPPVSPRPPRL